MDWLVFALGFYYVDIAINIANSQSLIALSLIQSSKKIVANLHALNNFPGDEIIEKNPAKITTGGQKAANKSNPPGPKHGNFNHMQ